MRRTASTVSRTVWCDSRSATFSVSVTGAYPRSFQWRKDGAPIGGATSQVLTIAQTAATDAGIVMVEAGAQQASEAEVLALLSLGRSNAEIAAQLFVSTGTVKTHVSHVLAKLGVPSRTQAALYAIRYKLIPSGNQKL